MLQFLQEMSTNTNMASEQCMFEEELKEEVGLTR
jgi:hypothetical protein